MNEKTSRRAFLVKPLQYVTAAGLMSAIVPSLIAQSRGAQQKIITRTLGRTGISLPVVSLGFMNANAPELIQRAYEVGMRHVDTAAFYQGGRNEEIVGATIKTMGVRDSVIIGTKVFLRGVGVSARDAQARDAFRQVAEASLKRLQADHVDILYYHSVDSAEDLRAEGPLQALAELKKEGKTRFIGVSTHQGAVVLPEAVRLGVFDVGLVPVNYTMASNTALLDAVDQAAKAGMGIIAMKTQAGGLLRPDRALPKDLPSHSQTALLKWALHNPSITTAIPGVTAFDQLEQNIAVAFDFEYSAAEKAFLGDRALMTHAQFCQQCGQCQTDCPYGVEIPTLMRSHMYAVQYANLDMARSTLACLDTGKGLASCTSCGACKAVCRNDVNIGGNISRLVSSRHQLAT
jgi:aryl-alcohol dehydrogenase-like predicted oxidoreductase